MTTQLLNVTFIGGPLHGQNKRLAEATQTYHEGSVEYAVSRANLDAHGKLHNGSERVYFVAQGPHAPDSVDALRAAIASVGPP